VLTPLELDVYIAGWQREHDPRSEIAIIEATSVDARGRARAAAPIEAQRRAARLSRTPGAIVGEIDEPATEVERVFCDHGALEVIDGELVIVALAPGVSASDLQALAVPTLKITHEVVEMVVDRPTQK
jgi:hypothetical protein